MTVIATSTPPVVAPWDFPGQVAQAINAWLLSVAQSIFAFALHAIADLLTVTPHFERAPEVARLWNLTRGIATGFLVVIALITTAGTAYTTIVARPDANQAFREVVFKEVAAHIENKIQPRVLLTSFADHVLYVRDVDANHVMHDVFFAETRPGSTTVTLAREGRFVIDRVHQVVQLQLTRATQHTMLAGQPDKHQATEFAQTSVTLDPQTVFKKQMPARDGWYTIAIPTLKHDEGLCPHEGRRQAGTLETAAGLIRNQTT